MCGLGVLSSYSNLSVLLMFMGKRVCSVVDVDNFGHVNSLYPCCFGIQIVSFISSVSTTMSPPLLTLKWMLS